MISRMNGVWDFLAPGGHFLGIQWHPWKLIGWLGNGVFFSRFLVQWYATEKRKQVVIPVAFWWLSIAGALLLFAYATLYQRDSVFIFAYAFTWIPYIRNLLIHYRHTNASRQCPSCSKSCTPEAKFCSACGTSLSKPLK
jgi:lipid-A-disaccharide synthase-like uncharacterized protein